MFIETKPTRNIGSGLSRSPPITTASIGVTQRLSKFRNDLGVPEIRIGVSEFKCIGISPPQDHPHVYINMGQADTILLSLLRDAVPLRSSIDSVRCRPAGQFLC